MPVYLFWLICFPLAVSSTCRNRLGIEEKFDCNQHNKLTTGKILTCAGDSRCIWQNEKDVFPLDDPKLFSEIEFKPKQSHIRTKPPKFPRRAEFDREAYSHLKTMDDETYASGLAVLTIDSDGVAYSLKFNEHYLESVLSKTRASESKIKVVAKKHPPVERGLTEPKVHAKGHRRRLVPWITFPPHHVAGYPESEMGVISAPGVMVAVASVYKHAIVDVDMGLFGTVPTPFNWLLTSAHNLYRTNPGGQGVWVNINTLDWMPQLGAAAGVHTPYRAWILRHWDTQGTDEYDMGAVIMEGPGPRGAPLSLRNVWGNGVEAINAYVTSYSSFDLLPLTMKYETFTMDCDPLSCESDDLDAVKSNCGSPVVPPIHHRLLGAIVVAEKPDGDIILAKVTALRRTLFLDLSDPTLLMDRAARSTNYGQFMGNMNDDEYELEYEPGKRRESVVNVYQNNQAESGQLSVPIDLVRSIQNIELVHLILAGFAILCLVSICCVMYVGIGWFVGVKVTKSTICGHKNDYFIEDRQSV
eukprot:113347_1